MVATSPLGRSEVTYTVVRRHLRGVPMILGGSKVSSERPQSDSSSGARHVWNDPKVPILWCRAFKDDER